MRWMIRHPWLVSFLLAIAGAALFALTEDGTFVHCADTCTVVRFTHMQRAQHTLIIGCTILGVARLLLFLSKVLRAALDARRK